MTYIYIYIYILNFLTLVFFSNYAIKNWNFQSAQTGTCDYSPDTMATVATLRGYETLPRNDYAAVMNHLATVGPLAVSGIIKQTAEKIINTIS